MATLADMISPEGLLRWHAELAEAQRAGHWFVQGSPRNGVIVHPIRLREKEADGDMAGRWRAVDPRDYLAELTTICAYRRVEYPDASPTDLVLRVEERISKLRTLLDGPQDHPEEMWA